MQWGPWKMNAENLTLEHRDGYEVSFGDCNSSAAILDWIFQVHGKSWADDATKAGLLDAFEDVLHPQENYCGNGQEHHGGGAKLAREYAANPNARDEMLAEFGKAWSGRADEGEPGPE